jgi:hypothetical protein
VPRRAAHIDIDDVGAGGLRDLGALRHPMGLAARKLNDVWPYPSRLAAQPGHRSAMYEIIAGGHLGDHESGPEGGGKASKGGIGDAGHRREENSVGDRNIAYLQQLKAWVVQAGHGVLIIVAAASSQPSGHIVSTNLVQSSFMPTL